MKKVALTIIALVVSGSAFATPKCPLQNKSHRDHNAKIAIKQSSAHAATQNGHGVK